MFRRKESVTCFFCGRECEPIYWASRLRIGLCEEHYTAYKRHAPTEVTQEFPNLVLKALIKVSEEHNESQDIIKRLKWEANFHAVCLENELNSCTWTHQDIDEALMHFGALNALTNILASIGHFEFRERKETLEKRLYDQGVLFEEQVKAES